MNTKVITEFVKVEALQTTTSEQILLSADVISTFLQNQDGFIDGELIKAFEGNVWYFIYHFENFEKLKVIGEKMRSNKMFDKIIPLIVPGSFNVTFFKQEKKW